MAPSCTDSTVPTLEETLRAIGLPESHADAPALLAADVRALWLGDEDVGHRLLARAIERHPSHADLNELCARAALAAGDPRAGYEYVAQALAEGGADGPRLALMGQCLVRADLENPGVLAVARAAEYDNLPAWLRAQTELLERVERARAVVDESVRLEASSGPGAALDWICSHHDDLSLRTFCLRRRRGLLEALLERWTDAFDTLSLLSLCARDDVVLLLCFADVCLQAGEVDLALEPLQHARRFPVPEPATSLLEARIREAVANWAKNS